MQKPLSIALLSLILASAIALPPSVRAQGDAQINVGVRSLLDRQKDQWNGKTWDGIHLRKLPDAPEHSKLYGILKFQRIIDVYGKLVAPVDEEALKGELIRQLNSHGFIHAGPTRRPDILLMVAYGRSYLPNPYYVNTTDVYNMGPELMSLPAQIAELYGMGKGAGSYEVSDINVLNRLRTTGGEEKATRGNMEKLLIMVRAWKNPTDPKEKPTALWVCTMSVDDPDHRDLNLVAKQMLEAGAPFFDKQMKYEGMEIMKPVPDGRVNVGMPEVVKPAATN